MGISRTAFRGPPSASAQKTTLLRRAVVLSLACLANACSYGMTAAKYPPALGPRGVSVRVNVGERQLSGELIEVRESGLVILAATRVMPLSSPASPGASSQARDQGRLQFVAYGEILSSTIDRTGSSFAIMGRRTPDRNVREHLRLLSRFPQGLTAELLQLLLTAHGQTELGGLGP